MPGIPLIGDSRNFSRSRPTSLAAEARSASRLLRLLKNNQVASGVLVESLARIQLHHDEQINTNIRQSVKDTLVNMGKHGWHIFPKGQAEMRMALALQYAVAGAVSGKLNVSRNNKRLQEGPSNKSSITEDPPVTTVLKETTTAAPAKSTAVVSDSSSAESASEEEEARDTMAGDDDAGIVETTRTSSLERAQVIKKFWAVVLESLHLHVASRTTTVWGSKKRYEIYQLCSAVRSVKEVTQICQGVEREFRTVFHGGTEDHLGCRAYATLREHHHQSCLYIQLNIGKSYDYQDERNRASCGEKKKKKPNEYTAVVIPGSSLIALTASRSASHPTARFTKYVLTALESVLCSVSNVVPTNKNHFDASLVPERFGDWAGTEPRELLKSAQAAHTGRAVGRFARYASATGVDGTGRSDPLLDLQLAAATSQLDRSDEQRRLKTGARHGRRLAQLEQQVSQASGGTAALVAANENGGGMLVDHSAAQKRRRKRARDQELGRAGDCPKRQRVAWKWTGETTAAAACWYGDDEEVPPDLPKTKFKCGIVMEGPNVFEGLRALVAAGLAKAPLPDFVRDAPTLGSATITVDNGNMVVPTRLQPRS